MDLKNAKVNIDLSEAGNMPSYETKRKTIRTYDLIFGILVAMFGGMFFFVLSLSIATGSWLIAFFAATPYISAFCVYAITAGSRKVINVIGLISLLPSVFFALSLVHVGMILLGFVCIMLASYKMRSALFGTVKIQPFHAMQSGVMFFLLGIAFVVSSQYYFSIRSNVATDLIPQLDQSSSVRFIAAQLLEKAALGGADKAGANEVMTVDAFLRSKIPQADVSQISVDQTNDTLNAMAQNMGIDPSLFAHAAQDALSDAATGTQQALLEESRKSLSDSLGISLEGDESLVDVVIAYMNIRINTMILENEQLSLFLPLLLTFFVFATIISLSPFLRYVWVFVAYVLFLVLKVYGPVKVMSVRKDVEVIQL